MRQGSNTNILGAAVLAAACVLTLPGSALGQDRRSRDAVPSECQSRVGQTVAVSSFAEVWNQLPTVPPRDEYESSADYAVRLSAAALPAEQVFTIRRNPSLVRQGLTYDPDRRTLTVYRDAFGAAEVNFGAVMRVGRERGRDNFASAIGFMVGQTQVDTDTYEATNGFGARFQITRTLRRVEALWERAGELGEDPFEGMQSGRVAVLTMEPATARALIEQGGAALEIAARPPYRITGQSTLAATFQRPRDILNETQVLTGDIRCGFLLDANDTVLHAFAVK